MTEDQRNSIIEKFAYIGISCYFAEETVLKVSFKEDKKSYHFNVYLDECFPESFPLIQISEDDFNGISKPLPHVYGNHYICVFDKTTSIPDYNNPVDLIVTTVSYARDIFLSGLHEDNRKDFIDEIASYWELDSNHCCKIKVHSFVCRMQTVHTISIFRKTSDIRRSRLLIADNSAAIKTIISHMVDGMRAIGDTGKRGLINGLYVPLKSAIYPPFPETNLDWYNLIQSFAKDDTIYRAFVSKHLEDGAYILLSIPLDNDKKFLFMIKHTPTAPLVRNGFRKGKFPAKWAFLHGKSQNVVKYKVEDLSHSRLFRRGGMGSKTGMNDIGIIGIGSLGSYLAKGLAEYGVTKLSLIDEDVINPENIARHLCGYKYLYRPKANAVMQKLTCHEPSMDISDFQMTGEKYLHDYLVNVNQMECLFIAAADWKLERLIYRMKYEGALKIPVIVLWVEPYCLAGHALIIQTQQDVQRILFDESLRFKYCTINNADSQFRREAGCQSTFIPYSAFEIRRFVYTFLHYFIVNFVDKKKKGNYSYTWCGELSKAQSLGCKLMPIYREIDDYTECIKRFD